MLRRRCLATVRPPRSDKLEGNLSTTKRRKQAFFPCQFIIFPVALSISNILDYVGSQLLYQLLYHLFLEIFLSKTALSLIRQLRTGTLLG